MSTDVTVIILTRNEEENLPQALDSVCGWAGEVLVLDSFSSDRTLEIARGYGCGIFQNRFVDYAKQRNHALDHLPVSSEWVLFLDADEWMPDELKREISEIIASNPEENGFYLNRRLVWMGKWIRRGYYPTWILRLFRRGKARCEERAINEHLMVEGKAGFLRNDFIHQDRKGVADWIGKHNRYAMREALELLRNPRGERLLDARPWGSQAERKRWVRYKVWNRLPPLLRPFAYFFYRYLLRGGFLDGRAGFIYHFLQGLWFPLLIDVMYLEMKGQRGDPGVARTLEY